jgi:hypothetical protein
MKLKLEDSNSKCRILNLTNEFLNKEKDQAISTTVKLQTIIDNWATSHNNLNKILQAQIPHQCQKILGGDIDGAINAGNTKFENESIFQDPTKLANDFKKRFISHSFINQSLVDKHCVTNADGITTCQTSLSAIDPSKINPEKDYSDPSTETLLKFPVSNGEVHATKEVLQNHPECRVSDAEDTSGSDTPVPTSPLKYKIPQRTRPTSPKTRNHGIKHCYTCGDTSHKSAECNFDHSLPRTENFKLRTNKWTIKPNSLNCLPADCYTFLLNSVKRPIEKWVSVF